MHYLLAVMLLTAFGAVHSVEARGGDTVERVQSRQAEREAEAKKRLEKVETELQERVAKRDAAVARACEASEKRVTASLDRSNSSYRSGKAFEKLVVKVDELVPKLQAAGTTTTNLEAANAALKTNVDAYVAAQTALTTALIDAKGLVCGESEGAYKAAVQEIRATQLPAVKKAHAAMVTAARAVRKELAAVRPVATASPSASPVL